jgi:hypothetical protein
MTGALDSNFVRIGKKLDLACNNNTHARSNIARPLIAAFFQQKSG